MLLAPLLPLIAEDATAKVRAAEACDVIDTLFSLDGATDLSTLASGRPLDGWTEPAKLTFHLCAEVIRLAAQLAAKCSARLATGDDARMHDLHVSHFLLPLLKLAICSVRYHQLSPWHSSASRGTARARSRVR